MPIVIPPAAAATMQRTSFQVQPADVAADLTALATIFTLPDGVTASQLKNIAVNFNRDGSATVSIGYTVT